MKKILSLLLSGAIVISSSAIVATAAGTTNSTATIELTAGELTIDPEGDNYPGIEGQGMNFGTHQISAVDQTYSTVANKSVGVQVSDGRGQAQASWKVKVAASTFTNSLSEHSLQGYKLVLTPVADSIQGPVAPTNIPVQNTVTLFESTEQVLFQSNATNGSPGRWGANWTPTLEIKSTSATQSSHKATIVWTVESAL